MLLIVGPSEVLNSFPKSIEQCFIFLQTSRLDLHVFFLRQGQFYLFARGKKSRWA